MNVWLFLEDLTKASDGGIINQTLKSFKSYNEKVLVAEGMLP
jgi:hypothetical protein